MNMIPVRVLVLPHNYTEMIHLDERSMAHQIAYFDSFICFNHFIPISIASSISSSVPSLQSCSNLSVDVNICIVSLVLSFCTHLLQPASVNPLVTIHPVRRIKPLHFATIVTLFRHQSVPRSTPYVLCRSAMKCGPKFELDNITNIDPFA